MNLETSLKLYERIREFIKDKEKAKTFVQKIEATVADKMEQHHQNIASKTDLAELKSELIKSIYLVGLVQFLSIVGSVLAIFQ